MPEISTEASRAVVKDFFSALRAGDMDTLRNTFAPDATWTLRGTLPASGTWTGLDGILDGTVESWGSGERFGYSPLPDGRVYCFAVANAHEGDPGQGLAGLRARFSGWHRPIPALLDAADPDAVLHDDLYELPPLRTYTAGQVVLVGDAAHAMTPNLGQGACQALEDAVVLAASLDGPGGLAAYDRARRRRTQMITLRSHRIGVAAQWESPVAVRLRNTALRLLPHSSFIRSLAPVLDWAP